jgi:hypothetical protein
MIRIGYKNEDVRADNRKDPGKISKIHSRGE